MSINTPNEELIQLTPADVVGEPFPHAVKQGMLRPDFYRRLKDEFPPDHLFDNRGKRIGARTGRDLYQGDTGFDEFIKSSPAWSKFHQYMKSPQFLELTLRLFGPYFQRFHCRVDPEEAHTVDYTEKRLAVWLRARLVRWFGIKSNEDPNQLFMRFDIEQSDAGYYKPVHCDNPSRLASFLVYFCDAGEIGLDGGDLRIHQHLENKPYPDYERHPKEEHTKVIATLRPKENLGLFFLCSNNSYHSVTSINHANDYRRFIYLNMSSRAAGIW